MKPKTFRYDIYSPSELSAGIRAYSDTVTVTVHSGDIGGLDEEFEEHIRASLREWFDGASVTIVDGE